MGDQHKAREAAHAWVAVRPWFVSDAVREQFFVSGEHVQYLDFLTALDVLAIDHGLLRVELPTEDLVLHSPEAACTVQGFHPPRDCTDRR